MQHKYHYFSSFAVLLIVFCLPGNSFSQNLNWEPLPSPQYSDFSKVVEDKHSGRFWGISENRVYYSDDRAFSWIAVGLDDVPSDAGFAFGSSGITVVNQYVSLDRGASWQKNNWPDSIDVRSIVVSDNEESLFVAAASGLYKSIDNGNTWDVLREGDFYKLWVTSSSAIVASHQPDLQVNPQIRKLIISQNEGNSWQDLNTPNLDVQDFIEGSDGTYHLLLKSNNVNRYGRSTDRGVTWAGARSAVQTNTFVGTGLNGEVYSSDGVTYMAHTENLNGSKVLFKNEVGSYSTLFTENREIYFFSRSLGHRKSTDFGKTWERVSTNGISPAKVTKVEYLNGRLWTATQSDGLFSTSDGGLTWQNHGLQRQKISAFLFDDKLDKQWAATNVAVYSAPHANSWWEELGDMYNAPELRIPIKEFIYDAGEQITYAWRPNDIYFSKDDGESWKSLNVPLANNRSYFPVSSMTIGTNSWIYLRIPETNNLPDSNSIYISRDLGATWDKSNISFEGEPETSVMMSDSKGNFWLAEDFQLYKSVDRGYSWSKINNNKIGFITDILETSDGSIWVSHYQGLERSLDGGVTWQSEHDDLPDPSVLSLDWDPQRNEIIVGTYPDGYLRANINTLDTPNSRRDDQQLQVLSGYPNPTSSMFSVDFRLESESKVSVFVYDLLGRRVQRTIVQSFAAGNQQLDVDVSKLAKGAYFIRVVSGGDSSTIPLIKN